MLFYVSPPAENRLIAEMRPFLHQKAQIMALSHLPLAKNGQNWQVLVKIDAKKENNNAKTTQKTQKRIVPLVFDEKKAEKEHIWPKNGDKGVLEVVLAGETPDGRKIHTLGLYWQPHEAKK